jgi:hypothetical protein
MKSLKFAGSKGTGRKTPVDLGDFLPARSAFPSVKHAALSSGLPAAKVWTALHQPDEMGV